MAYSLKDSIKDALQGLAFWISYRQTLYRWHLLNEGSLVVEFVNLLNARLAKVDSEFKIECESQYEDSGRERMDVEITRKDDSQVAIIEFKRYLAGPKAIKEDMKKLLNRKNSNVSCFLVVVSEGKRPEKYVDNYGKAIKGNLNPNGDFSAFVRGVLKSTGTLKRYKKRGKNSSKVKDKLPKMDYCCLIEILP